LSHWPALVGHPLAVRKDRSQQDAAAPGRRRLALTFKRATYLRNCASRAALPSSAECRRSSSHESRSSAARRTKKIVSREVEMTVAGDETHVASDERVDLEWLDLLERGERCSKPRKRSSLQGLPAEDNAAGVVTCFAKVACCISCPMADAEDRLKPLGHLAKDSTSRKETVLQVFGSYAHPRNSTKRSVAMHWQWCGSPT
jgi:hypothetical protein